MSLVEVAHQNGRAFVGSLARAEQKGLGQFMTPPAIARLMASRALSGVDDDVVRILEPAAGAGILAAAVVDALLDRNDPPSRIELTICEIDTRLAISLKALVSQMRRLARARGVSFSCRFVWGDFLLSSLACRRLPHFDLCVANPPYFKLNKKDDRSVAHAYAVHGQPNIYGLFQAVCASLLVPGGRWCFITPRSWMSGAYFTAVRRHLLRHLHIDGLHLFESRKAHFEEDEILQEAVIAWATAQMPAEGTIAVSTSEGVADLQHAQLYEVPTADVIGNDEHLMIAVPVAAGAEQGVGLVNATPETLASLGLQVSTGPVVPFRSKEHILENRRAGSVPLLWMQHVSRVGIRWPIQKKREHIMPSALSAWMLLHNANYVVMRRFSPKEESRRVTAAPYLANLPGDYLGLENHLNYIYRPGGELARDETVGISAFLNSHLVDRYFRSVSGNTQVNATELRKLPMPSLPHLVAIGRLLPDRPTLAEADAAVDQVLGAQPLAERRVG